MSATPDDIELHKLVGTALDFELELVCVEVEGSYKRGDWELSWAEKVRQLCHCYDVTEYGAVRQRHVRACACACVCVCMLALRCANELYFYPS